MKHYRPKIAKFDLAQHDHSNADQGGFLNIPDGHPRVTIAPGSTTLASIDANQVLTINQQGQTQVQSNWGQSVITEPDFIKNKPTFDLPFEWCISAGVAQTETIDIYASRPYKIKLFIAESDGTLASVSIKIDGVSVTGLNALSVSILASYTATALNSVMVGQRVTIVFGTGYSGVPTKLKGKLIIEV